MNREESRAWRPGLPGWSDDILPFYARIAEQLGPRARVVEIGTAHGRSAIFLAETLLRLGKPDVEIWCVDCWAGAWFAECMQSIATFARAEELAMLRILRTTSTEAVKLFENESIDFVFVDGDHEFEGARDDIARWVWTVKPDGTFAGHDFNPQFPGVIRAVDDVLEGRHHLDTLEGSTVWIAGTK
jgi:hypothetical protein